MSRTFPHLRVRIRHSALALAIIAAAGCTTLIRSHGFVPLPEDLEQMTVGQTTRDDVINLVGPATTSGGMDDETLYYVATRRERIGPFAPEIADREVVVVSFAPNGTLANIERFGLENGRVVMLSRRITDDGLADVSFLGQLFGSFGNIDASTLLDGPLGDG